MQNAQVGRMGLKDDRRMMLVNETGNQITQRERPRLALVTPTLQEGVLTLSAPDYDSLQIGLRTSGVRETVTLWKRESLQAIDQGDEAADWFSTWIGVRVRLMHMADGFQRLLEEDWRVQPDDHTGFADGYPVLITSEEGLQDLNQRLETPVPMNRFRPNLVVKGGPAYVEDRWNRICVGDVQLAVVKPCARCVVTTIDKDTLAKSKEPLRTLEKYRRHPLGAIFGQNAIPLNTGTLHVGMPIEVLSER